MLFHRERALGFMERFDLDALIATTRHNVLYLSGFQGWAQETYGDAVTETFALFFRNQDSPPALILSRQDETYYAAMGSWIEDVRGYGPRSALDVPPGERGANEEERNYVSLIAEDAPREGSATDALLRVLRERGLSSGRVALDGEGVRPSTRARAEAAVPGASFLDASHLFRLIRLQKTPEEVERMRAAALLNERAVAAFHAEMAPGRTEREAARRYYRTVAEGGGKWSWFHLGGGRRSASIFPPSDRRFAPGDGFFFDAGMRLNHYCADVGCCGSFGEPNAERKAQWRAIQAGLEAALGAIRAGVRPSAIFSRGGRGGKKIRAAPLQRLLLRTHHRNRGARAALDAERACQARRPVSASRFGHSAARRRRALGGVALRQVRRGRRPRGIHRPRHRDGHDAPGRTRTRTRRGVGAGRPALNGFCNALSRPFHKPFTPRKTTFPGHAMFLSGYAAPFI